MCKSSCFLHRGHSLAGGVEAHRLTFVHRLQKVFQTVQSFSSINEAPQLGLRLSSKAMVIPSVTVSFFAELQKSLAPLRLAVPYESHTFKVQNPTNQPNREQKSLPAFPMKHYFKEERSPSGSIGL